MTLASASAARSRASRAADAPYYWIAGALVAIVFAACGWWFGLRSPPPAIPTIDPQGMDPKIAAAIETAHDAVEEKPDSAAAWGRLGLVLRAHDYGAEANRCFVQAEKLDPKDPHGPINRGSFCSSRIRKPGWLVCGEPRRSAAGSLLHHSFWLKFCSAGAASTRRRDLYERVLAVDANDPRAHYGLGRIAYLRGDYATSLRELNISVRSAPWIQATHTLLAEIHYARGEKSLAAEEEAIANRLGSSTSWPDEYMDDVASSASGLNRASPRHRACFSRIGRRRRWRFSVRRPPVPRLVRCVPGAGESESSASAGRFSGGRASVSRGSPAPARRSGRISTSALRWNNSSSIARRSPLTARP